MAAEEPHYRTLCAVSKRDDSAWHAFSKRTLHKLQLRIISLRRLHRYVPQQELNLLQLAASRMAEPRAGSSTIVRRKLGDARLRGVVLHDMPDHLLGDAVAPNRFFPADASEQPPLRDRR